VSVFDWSTPVPNAFWEFYDRWVSPAVVAALQQDLHESLVVRLPFVARQSLDLDEVRALCAELPLRDWDGPRRIPDHPAFVVVGTKERSAMQTAHPA